MTYAGQQRHRGGGGLVNLSVKGQISPSYTLTSKFTVFYIFSICVSGGRREPTGRIATEDDGRGSLHFYCQAYGG